MSGEGAGNIASPRLASHNHYTFFSLVLGFAT
jgi:hypothetical protein